MECTNAQVNCAAVGDTAGLVGTGIPDDSTVPKDRVEVSGSFLVGYTAVVGSTAVLMDADLIRGRRVAGTASTDRRVRASGIKEPWMSCLRYEVGGIHKG